MPLDHKYVPTTENIKSFSDHLSKNPRIIIITHSGPDGDAIGSAVALYDTLQNRGHDVIVACTDAVPENLRWIKKSDEIVQDFDVSNFDMVIFIDCGDKKATRFVDTKPSLLSDDIIKVNIDHHSSNDAFGDINYINTEAASATVVLYDMFRLLEWDITPTSATALLVGIYTDTGSFMHQNTTPHTYHVASRLVQMGANAYAISNNIFRKYSVKTLKLWGKVLKNFTVTPEKTAIVGIKKEDYVSLDAKRDDLSGVVDYLNSLDDVKYTVILSEDEKGRVKASLRTRHEDVDVNALAAQYGGGGHVKAAGFSVPNGYLQKEVRWKIVQNK